LGHSSNCEKLDDKGRLELLSEEQMYSILGMKKENEKEEQEREGRRCGVGSSSARKGCEDGSATIPIFQNLPGEKMVFDRNNLVIKSGSLYHSMKEFELGIEATDKRRHIGYCRCRDYPWSIAARVKNKG
jgi:hypothetical protein